MNVKQYDLVRISKLLHLPDQYNGWEVNERAPEVGDVGTIVEILSGPNLPDCYVVEAVQDDGYTTWLCNFSAEEIEAITDQSAV